jgi:SAM-dependent methyltransferase
MGNAIPADASKIMDGRTLLHRFRYHLGRGYVTPEDEVIECGCGTGYGTEILSEVAKYVTGYDMENSNIYVCNLKHKRDNNEFIEANLEEHELKPADIATSFEVIEHLYEPAKFVTKLKKLIRKFIIVSVPIGETLIEVDGKPEVRGDSTHHNVYPTPEHLDALFLDEDWGRFYGFRSGVTYMAVYYNRNQYDA